MVLRALSATARACSICVACRWLAMYCSHSRELSGEASSRRSKAAASSGRRLGFISSVSRCTRAFSAAFFSCSSSWRVFFWVWWRRTSPSCATEAGFRELSPTSQEKPAASCSLDGAAEL
ncbi:hypothetical protein F7725_016041 [Dissostichus mawsoni]|uniref:Uncharacterized protein n=1 Tax=Dissostichus mawsoni TaxID=36200 RepID=A0A7J5Y4E1_DISMA|nr:hypothetical protein F7725_016041 [Dissostichus mawsoni]